MCFMYFYLWKIFLIEIKSILQYLNGIHVWIKSLQLKETNVVTITCNMKKRRRKTISIITCTNSEVYFMIMYQLWGLLHDHNKHTSVLGYSECWCYTNCILWDVKRKVYYLWNTQFSQVCIYVETLFNLTTTTSNK